MFEKRLAENVPNWNGFLLDLEPKNAPRFSKNGVTTASKVKPKLRSGRRSHQGLAERGPGSPKGAQAFQNGPVLKPSLSERARSEPSPFQNGPVLKPGLSERTRSETRAVDVVVQRRRRRRRQCRHL